MLRKLNTSRALARYEIASGATIAADNLVALNSTGKAVAASDSANLTVIGVAVRVLDAEVEVDSGIVGIANSSSHALTRADRGKAAYVESASAVSSESGTNGVVAGVVVDVRDGEVFVAVSPEARAAAVALRAIALKADAMTAATAIADVTAAGEASATLIAAVNSILAALRANGIVANS